MTDQEKEKMWSFIVMILSTILMFGLLAFIIMKSNEGDSAGIPRSHQYVCVQKAPSGGLLHVCHSRSSS